VTTGSATGESVRKFKKAEELYNTGEKTKKGGEGPEDVSCTASRKKAKQRVPSGLTKPEVEPEYSEKRKRSLKGGKSCKKSELHPKAGIPERKEGGETHSRHTLNETHEKIRFEKNALIGAPQKVKVLGFGDFWAISYPANLAERYQKRLPSFGRVGETHVGALDLGETPGAPNTEASIS